MEPFHGRRGGKDPSGGMLCGIHRATQTMLLMVAMVATMAVVLVWEASPLVLSGRAQSPVIAVSEGNAEVYRPFSRSPPTDTANDGVADLTESDRMPVTDGTEIVEPVGEETKSVSEPAPSMDESVSTTANETLGMNVTSSAESTLTTEEEAEIRLESSPDVKSVPMPAIANATQAPGDAREELAAGNAREELAAGNAREELAAGNAREEQAAADALEEQAAADARDEQAPVGESGDEQGGDAREEQAGDAMEEEEMCDYSAGKWVVDEHHPLYSGLECKMWLSPGFSCRLNHHPDKLLDRYRWQPYDCDLPVFNATGVLEMLRNKVVAFVGDSLGRQQFQSLMCMLTRGKSKTSITDIGKSFGFYTPRGKRKPNGFAFRYDATNTTIMYKWSVTLARIQPLNSSDRNSETALHLDRPEEFIEKHLPVVDILVLNSGHHWNGGKMRQNRFVFHLGGKPVTPKQPEIHVPVAYNVTVYNVVHWVHEAIKDTPEKIVYYRSLSPRHFRNGDWNTGGTCDPTSFVRDKVVEGARIDPNAERAVMGTTVNLLNITSLSFERGETHVSKYGGGKGGQDCLHWCLPGIPDTWNEVFFAELAYKLKLQKKKGVSRST